MRSTLRVAATTLALTGLLTSPLRANVLVVDASGAGAFTQISAAVAVAADGDVVLVKSGTYAPFTITNRSLDVVADVGANVLVQGTVVVTTLNATRAVTLTALRIAALSGVSPALGVSNCTGAVRVQGCTLTGFDQPNCLDYTAGGRAVDVFGCTNVAFAACTVRGGKGSDTADPLLASVHAGDGGVALVSFGSRLAIYDCTIVGGVGGGEDTSCPGSMSCCSVYGGNGGNGAQFTGAPIVYLSNSTVRGGGAGLCTPGYGYCGGSGMVLLNQSHARSTQSVFEPGLPSFMCLIPYQGMILGVQSTAQTLPGASRRISAGRVPRESALARVDFFGQPGDQVRLVMAEAPRFVYSATEHGVHLVQRPHPSPVQWVGTLGPSGTLNQAWVVPDLGAGVQSRRFFLQAEFIDTSGQKTVSTPATLILLDSAF